MKAFLLVYILYKINFDVYFTVMYVTLINQSHLLIFFKAISHGDTLCTDFSFFYSFKI